MGLVLLLLNAVSCCTSWNIINISEYFSLINDGRHSTGWMRMREWGRVDVPCNNPNKLNCALPIINTTIKFLCVFPLWLFSKTAHHRSYVLKIHSWWWFNFQLFCAIVFLSTNFGVCQKHQVFWTVCIARPEAANVIFFNKYKLDGCNGTYSFCVDSFAVLIHCCPLLCIPESCSQCSHHQPVSLVVRPPQQGDWKTPERLPAHTEWVQVQILARYR